MGKDVLPFIPWDKTSYHVEYRCKEHRGFPYTGTGKAIHICSECGADAQNIVYVPNEGFKYDKVKKVFVSG